MIETASDDEARKAEIRDNNNSDLTFPINKTFLTILGLRKLYSAEVKLQIHCSLSPDTCEFENTHPVEVNVVFTSDITVRR